MERRGRFYHLVGTYLGRRVRKSLQTTDFTRAQQMLATELEAIRKAQEKLSPSTEARSSPVSVTGEVSAPVSKSKTTLAECFEIYLKRSHSGNTRRLVERLANAIDKDALYGDVDEAFVESLASRLCRPGVVEATIKRQVVAPLQAVMRRAHKRFGTTRHLPSPEFGDFEPAEKRTVILYPDQAERMIAIATEEGWCMTASIIEVACCEGPRRGELWSLQWEAVDLERRRLILRDTKTDHGSQRDRTIKDARPRSISSLRRLASLTGKDRGAVLLRGPDDRQLSLASFGIFVNKQLKVLSKRADILDTITLHVLRHTAASWHHLVEPDLKAVQTRMDWRTISITDRYIHLLEGTDPTEVLRFWEKMAQT